MKNIIEIKRQRITKSKRKDKLKTKDKVEYQKTNKIKNYYYCNWFGHRN